MHVDGAGVRVQFSGAEVALLIAPVDGDDNVVSRVGRRGADAEDLSGNDDVGLKAQLVVGDPCWSVLARHKVGAADPLTASGRHEG